jgi:hypothetical protein
MQYEQSIKIWSKKMADFNTFIKLHRSILESAVFTDAEVLRLWIYLLCKASVDDRQIIFDGRIIDIKKGQLITGRKKLAEHIGTSESKIYRSLKLLEDLKCIKIEVNNKFSLVTVEKWEKFQGGVYKSEQQKNNSLTSNQHQTNNRLTADQQQTNTIKECKIMYNNENNVNNGVVVDDTATQKKVSVIGGKLGKGVLVLSDEQFEDLLQAMPLNVLEQYMEKLADFIINKKAFVRNHYETIKKWYQEDYGS